MDIEEGQYKIKHFNRFCFMKVMKKEGKLHYSIGASEERPIDELSKYFSHPIEIIEKVHPLDPLINVKVTIEWQDLRQDKFSITTNNTKHLREIFNEYPQLLDRLKNTYYFKK